MLFIVFKTIKTTSSIYRISKCLQIRNFEKSHFLSLPLKKTIDVKNERTDDPKYLNTNAFLQIVKGNHRSTSSRAILPGIIVVALFAIGVQLAHVPQPSKCQVERIIGNDPALTKENDSSNVIRTVAHRGAGLDAPENTLAAFQLCSQKGVNFIEFDITLTADNVPVVFHDDTLERMAGLQEYISKKSYNELKNVDISVKHPFKEKYQGAQIPTLDETVQQLLKSGQNMFIDIKDNNNQMVSVILAIYEKYPELYDKAITSSFFPNIIYLIRKRNPKIVCSLAWRPCAFSHVSYNYATGGKGLKRANAFYKHYFYCLFDWLHESLLMTVTYYMLGISFILLHKDAISGRVVMDWRERGVRVIAWTANHPVEKQYLARVLKITYMTDTLTGESTTHSHGLNNGINNSM